MIYRKGFISQDKSWGGVFFVHYLSSPGGRVYRKMFNTRIEARHFLAGKPKPTTHEMIRSYMRENEKTLLAYIRKLNRNDVGYSPFFASSAWSNALDRLKGKKKVVYSKALGGYVVRKGR